jgi:hypothetical protein
VRLWSVHPKYLDARGLVALWREALMAQSVLLGNTKGYRNHPQLERFKSSADPVAAIGSYLRVVYREACRRGYNFDQSKIARQEAAPDPIPVTDGQLAYEGKHLRSKLAIRDPKRLESMPQSSALETHPLFIVITGPVEGWERLPAQPG